MRLFIGIELPDDVKRAAARTADDIRARLRRVAPHASVRWVDPANLHITLWFLGEVAEPTLAGLSSALAEPFQASTFTMRIGGAGGFPPSGPPRAMWLGITSGAQQVAAVHAELGPRLTPLGFAPERRAFAAHLTIARVKDVRRSEGAALRRALNESAAEVEECAVTGVTLFRSRLSPEGSQYESLLRVPLA